MFASRRRLIAQLAGLTFICAGCRAWQVQPVSPETLLAAPSAPSRVRLRLRDSTHIVLIRPRLKGDSVAGTLSLGGMPREPRSVPLAGITEVAVRRFAPGRTLGLVAGGFAALYAIAFVACSIDPCVPDFGSAAGP